MVPSAISNADRRIGRVPAAHHVAPMLRRLLSPQGFSIPALGGAPSAQPEPAMSAVGGAPTFAGRAFEVKPGGRAGSPEMSYVSLGSRPRGATAEQPARRVVTETRIVEVLHERDKERTGAARILKASVGREHRPLLSNAADSGHTSDEPRQSGVNALDLDRLASQVYGRIKQRLAVDRERRGFVR
jgi:hypothetical protein